MAQIRRDLFGILLAFLGLFAALPLVFCAYNRSARQNSVGIRENVNHITRMNNESTSKGANISSNDVSYTIDPAHAPTTVRNTSRVNDPRNVSWHFSSYLDRFNATFIMETNISSATYDFANNNNESISRNISNTITGDLSTTPNRVYKIQIPSVENVTHSTGNEPSSSGNNNSSDENEVSSRRNPAPETRPPNIVFVLSDDQGFHDIGYHSPDLYTPNLDLLARSGVRLENYYVQPACTPSRSQLLTGRYQTHLGTQHRIFQPCQPYGLPLEFPTIADALRRGNYSTHAVGKWHQGFYKEEYMPLNRGFDSFYGILPGAATHTTYRKYASIKTVTDTQPPRTVRQSFDGYCLYDNNRPALDGFGTYSTHLYTRKAIEVVRRTARENKPLFLYLSYQAPHSPLEAPESYYSRFVNIKNQRRRIYAGMLSAMDEGIGNLTSALKEVGMWNNTVFIFSSDNGGQVSLGGSNWPLRGNKATLWEGGVRTVGFVASPLLEPEQKGKVSRGLMHVSDWFPTLANVAGLEQNETEGLDGFNQWPMIKNGSPSPRSEILHNIDPLAPPQGTRQYNETFDTRMRAALRVGDLKIITGDPGNGEWYGIPGVENIRKPNRFLPAYNATAQNVWLFNVSCDPLELVDLAPSMPGKVLELLDRLQEHQASARPVWYPDPDPQCNPRFRGGVWGPWL